MSAFQGAPPLLGCFDWSIDRACEIGNHYTLPDDMRYHLILVKFCDRVTKIMSGNLSSPLGMPADGERVLLMNVLEDDLDTLEAQFSGKLSRESQGFRSSRKILANSVELDNIHLVEARLYLRIFYFFDSTYTDHRRSGILKAYSTATEFITLANSSQANFNYLTHGPISAFRYLSAALAILLQVLNSNLSACVDHAAGADFINAGLAALRIGAVESNDVFLRASEVYTSIWRMQQDDQEIKQQSPKLLIQSRLGASLLYDTLWKWRQYHVKGKSLEQTSKYSTIMIDVEQTSADDELR